MKKIKKKFTNPNFTSASVNGNLKKEALIDNCETSRLRRVQK